MISRLLFIVLCFCVTTACFAQQEQLVNPADRKQRTEVTEPATLFKGFFRAGASVSFSSINQLFNKDGDRIRLENTSGRSWNISPTINYGVTDRFQVSLTVPYQNRVNYVTVRTEFPEDFTFETETFTGSGSGISDVTLRLDYQLLNMGSDQFLVATLEPTFPTGQSEPQNESDQPVGNGYFSTLLALEYTRIFYPFRLELYSGYNINFEADLVRSFQADPVRYNTGNRFFFNVRADFMLNDWLSFLNLLSYNQNSQDRINGELIDYDLLDDFDNGTIYSLIYTPGLSFQVRQFRFNQIFFFPIAGKNSGASPGYSLILQYVF